MAIVEIKIKDIKPGENYRKHQDKGGMKELTQSVKTHGVLQPIIVRKNGKGYEIVAGHRRHEAATSAGLKTIPASVIKVDDAEALEIAVIENTQREDPNPMDEAIGFKRLLELGKHMPDTLAKKLGKSLSYVYTRLKLNDLPKDCQKALLNSELDFSIAVQLCRLTDKKDMSDFLADILDQDMSAAQVRSHIQSEYGQRLDSVIFDKTGCDKCPNRSVTQAALFPGVDGEDDRCMDEKCWRKKNMDHLAGLAGGYEIKGWNIIRDAEEIRKLDRKGVKIGWNTPLKTKCKPCLQRAFFYADADGRIVYGWWCSSKKCHDEVYYGIKPRDKSEASLAKPAKDAKEGEEQQSSSSDSSDQSAPSEELDKVTVPGLTDPVTVECPCCFMDIRLLPEVKDVAEVVESAEVVE